MVFKIKPKKHVNVNKQKFAVALTLANVRFAQNKSYLLLIYLKDSLMGVFLLFSQILQKNKAI